jgi:hypothetical protein
MAWSTNIMNSNIIMGVHRDESAQRAGGADESGLDDTSFSPTLTFRGEGVVLISLAGSTPVSWHRVWAALGCSAGPPGFVQEG